VQNVKRLELARGADDIQDAVDACTYSGLQQLSRALNVPVNVDVALLAKHNAE
jgi:hypothetical protein